MCNADVHIYSPYPASLSVIVHFEWTFLGQDISALLPDKQALVKMNVHSYESNISSFELFLSNQVCKIFPCNYGTSQLMKFLFDELTILAFISWSCTEWMNRTSGFFQTSG